MHNSNWSLARFSFPDRRTTDRHPLPTLGLKVDSDHGVLCPLVYAFDYVDSFFLDGLVGCKGIFVGTAWSV